MHMSGVAPVNETLTRELSGVCKACFSSDAGGKARGVHIEVRRVGWFAGLRVCGCAGVLLGRGVAGLVIKWFDCV